MAGRPYKRTAEYYSHDADANEGRTLTVMFNHFGHEGRDAWWTLLSQLCKNDSQVINVASTQDFEYLAARMQFSPERLRSILGKMAELDAIDKELYASGIIWSSNLVERLSLVYQRRKQPLPQRPVVNKPISVDGNAITVDGKYTKDSIVKDSIVNIPLTPLPPLDEKLAKAYSLWENNMGPLGSITAQKIADSLQEYGLPAFENAVGRTVAQKGKGAPWAYFVKVLSNHNEVKPRAKAPPNAQDLLRQEKQNARA